MNSDELKRRALALLQNQYLIIGVQVIIGAVFIYYLYNKNMAPAIKKISDVEQNITMLKEDRLAKDIRKLKQEKISLVHEESKLKEKVDKFGEVIYKNSDDIAIAVIGKLNLYKFDIYEYKMDTKQNIMELTVNGSYAGLMNFYDHVYSMYADVKIVEYKIFIENNKMLVKTKIQIGVLTL
ncbi:MAG: hypothetical protein JXQ77_06025 [Campylobacterales bacterium]|nr:hypothetical protein [Campylobacterales bacterium]